MITKSAEELKSYTLSITSLTKELGQQVQGYIDTLTKPQGSLGRLEELAVQIATITGEPVPSITPPAVIVFAADHGIAQEGVSAYPQEVTAQMVANFLQGGAAINVFAKQIGASFQIVDIGVAQELQLEGYINCKVRHGTRNFLHEDALTGEEVLEAVWHGIEVAEGVLKQGARCLILGEMGIGNTTSSSAILALLSGQKPEKLVGLGTGITQDQLLHKIRVIEQALAVRQANPSDALDILAKVGGLEIAGMVGGMLAAGQLRRPILVDGFICTIAALLAVMLAPQLKEYLILAHQSQEPGQSTALQLLAKKPLLDLQLRLGEGSGAAVAFPLLQFAISMVREMATFTSAGVSTK